MRYAILVKARDRPGLLSDIGRTLSRAGMNIVFSYGFTEEKHACILLVAEDHCEPEELRQAILEVEGVLEVEVGALGPEAAEVFAEVASRRPGVVKALEDVLDPVDLFDVILRLDEILRVKIYPLLDDETLARILVQAGPEVIREVAESLDVERLSRIISRLEEDEAVDVLQKLPSVRARQVLERLPRDLARKLVGLIKYPSESAGGIMTTSVPVLLENQTVADALQVVRSGRYDIRDLIVVVDEKGVLKGVVSLDKLIREKPETKLKDIAEKPVLTARPEMDREEVARLMLRYDVSRLPVVDGEGRFLGIIAIEDVADVIAEELMEDIALFSGAEVLREKYITATIRELFRRRVLWLVAIYFVETLTVHILKAHEDLISRVAAIAAFIPLVMSTAGNTGSQASAMVIRALALGEISERSMRDVLKVLSKELRTSSMLGSVMALIGLGFAFIMTFNYEVALAVSLSLFLVTVIADILGSMLPILARRMNIDPAAISSPLLATIMDVTASTIYITLASILVFGVG